MNRIATIDQGNTRIKVSIFEADTIIYSVVWNAWDLETVQQLLYNHSVEKVILSSVGLTEPTVFEMLNREFDFIELTEKTPLPIRNDYETPATLGKDRIAAAMGAWKFYPQRTCLVIDAGTCITMDILTGEGAYLGGNITPGIRMRLQAMHTLTARLPQVAPGPQQKLWGTTTETALRNGGQYGAVYEVERYLQLCQNEWSDLVVVTTGGDGGFLAEQITQKTFFHPRLIEYGLLEVLRFNKI